MRISRTPRNWIRAAVIGIVLGQTAVSAEFPKPLETAGRLYGVGWGDGYHACVSSGHRLGADLPPKSYAASYGPKSHVKPTGIVHRIGATFYDRFDAGNARACDAPICESSSCDTGPCASGTAAASHGSQVSRTPDAVSPTIAAPIRETPLPQATTRPVKSEAAEAISPLPDPVTELTQPLTFAPATKKYPTRPEPPVLFRRSEAAAVATKHEPLKLPTPEKVLNAAGNKFAVNKFAGNWGQAIVDRSNAQPLSTISQPQRTTTPGSIAPIHPGGPPSTPARLSLPGNPIATSTPSMAVPLPGDRYVVPAAKPQGTTQPAATPGFVPSYAIAPYSGPETTELRAIEPAQNRPVRLGTETAQVPAYDAAIKSVADVKRPTRLGDGDAGLNFNPLDSRPVVEMAKRSGKASPSVIFQPSGGTLK